MLEPHSPEIRAQLAADRVAGLRHSARPVPPGLLRRSLGNAFVRFGLRLGSDGSVPPPAALAESLEEASARAGASSIRRAYPWRRPNRCGNRDAAPLGIVRRRCL